MRCATSNVEVVVFILLWVELIGLALFLYRCTDAIWREASQGDFRAFRTFCRPRPYFSEILELTITGPMLDDCTFPTFWKLFQISGFKKESKRNSPQWKAWKGERPRSSLEYARLRSGFVQKWKITNPIFEMIDTFAWSCPPISFVKEIHEPKPVRDSLYVIYSRSCPCKRRDCTQIALRCACRDVGIILLVFHSRTTSNY